MDPETDPNGHVLFNSFGLGQAQKQGLIDSYLRDSPAVRPTAAAQLSLMAYQTDYGIFDHINGDANRPLALVALHDKENTYEGGPILSLIRRFNNYRLYEQGYSFTEFVDLPYPMAMFIFEMAENAITQKDAVAERAEKELKKEMQGM